MMACYYIRQCVTLGTSNHVSVDIPINIHLFVSFLKLTITYLLLIQHASNHEKCWIAFLTATTIFKILN